MPGIRGTGMTGVTDIDFFTALQICMTADPEHKRCERCPLLRTDRPCEYILRDEIRHRLILARQERAKGFKQLSLI